MNMQKPRLAGLLALAAIAVMSTARAEGVSVAQAQTAYTVTAADLGAVATRLEADPALTEAACVALTPADGKTTSAVYSCAKPNDKTDAAFRNVLGADASLSSITATCPGNCVMTYCPYPNLQCCNVYTHMPCP